MVLLGRDGERAELHRLLAGLDQSSSAVLVIRGEAGVGKTALLEDTIASADGMRVLQLTGIESEMELGFAALHVLLLPLLGRLDTLPVPQRTALQSAFGLVNGEPPERFLVGLATLTLLSDAGNERPVLCVIDDAAVARSGVARGVHLRRPAPRCRPGRGHLRRAGPVRPGGGARRSAHARARWPRPRGGPRPARHGRGGESRAADRHAPVRRDAGNPMALLELGRDLTPEQLAGRSTLPDPLPLGRRLETKFVRQVRELPAPAQTLLLVAAAEPTGDAHLVYGAAERLGLSPDAGGAAEAAGLLAVRPVVAFRHPLIRSAVYHSVSGIERRRVHEALATVSDPERDGDRRAWHRAASVVDADEEIAGELEEAAERARRRGGYSGAAAFLTRAARLTPDSSRRATRLLAAAQADFSAGVPARAQLLVDEAVPELDDPLLRGTRSVSRARSASRWATVRARCRSSSTPPGRSNRSTSTWRARRCSTPTRRRSTAPASRVEAARCRSPRLRWR